MNANIHYQSALCRRMCRALEGSDAVEIYDLTKILDHAYDEVQHPALVARLLVSLRPLLPDLTADGHELTRCLSFRALGLPMPDEASLGYYDDGYGYDDNLTYATYEPNTDRDFDAGVDNLPPGSDDRKANSGGSNARNSSGSTGTSGSQSDGGDFWGGLRDTADMVDKAINKYPAKSAGQSGGQGSRAVPTPPHSGDRSPSPTAPQRQADTSLPQTSQGASGYDRKGSVAGGKDESSQWGVAAFLIALGVAAVATKKKKGKGRR